MKKKRSRRIRTYVLIFANACFHIYGLSSSLSIRLST
nr:MAG TPA: hypothetical protein [Caudoviricetes sp.]